MSQRKNALFLRALDASHGEPEYYEALEAVKHGTPRDVAQRVLNFLKGWGEMTRLPKEGSSKRRKLEIALAVWLREHRKDLEDLRQQRIWSANLSKIGPQLITMYDSLASMRKGFGPTATGKTLHVLLPGVCVIWDAVYVRNRQGFDEEGKDYLEYLKTRQTILLDLINEAKRETGIANDEALVESLIEQHARRWSGCRPPITKLLDEVNYDESPEFVEFLQSERQRSTSS